MAGWLHHITHSSFMCLNWKYLAYVRSLQGHILPNTAWFDTYLNLWSDGICVTQNSDKISYIMLCQQNHILHQGYQHIPTTLGNIRAGGKTTGISYVSNKQPRQLHLCTFTILNHAIHRYFHFSKRVFHVPIYGGFLTWGAPKSSI